MKRRTLIKRLQGLVELSEKARKLAIGDMSKWVERGFLTESEMVEYHEGMDAGSKISVATREAEDSIPRPDFDNDPRFPAEYLALQKKFTKLMQWFNDERAVRDILNNLRGSDSFSSRRGSANSGLRRLAETAFQTFRNAEDDTNSAYYETKKSIDRKEREGSIARRVRREIADDWQARKKDAGQLARDKATKVYGLLIKRQRELDRLMEQRQKELLTPIQDAMADIIREALPKGVTK